MAAVSTSIKLDPELKREAQDVLSRMGFSLNGAITMFLHQVVNDQAIPFRPKISASVSPSQDPFFDSPGNVARVKAGLEALQRGRRKRVMSMEDLEGLE